MGDWFQTIVDLDATEEEAPALGLSIRNWPPFEPFFIEEVSKQLGHRVVLVGGKV
jgi:hypothetical protein